jgi:hypothetical protein
VSTAIKPTLLLGIQYCTYEFGMDEKMNHLQRIQLLSISNYSGAILLESIQNHWFGILLDIHNKLFVVRHENSMKRLAKARCSTCRVGPK